MVENQARKLIPILLILLTGCTSTPREAQRPAGVKHVIVVGVDGMSPYGVQQANTPVMDDMMKNGAWTLNARGVLPASSSPNWASMVSGAGPEKHGVTSNGWERDDRNFPPVSTGMEDIFPTIFGVVRKQYPDMEIGAVYNWSGFGRLIERSALNHDVTRADIAETVTDAVSYIKDKKPGFLFVHMDHVDHAGHQDGHRTKKYYEAVALADTYIGQIVQAAKDAGIFEETVFIVSADHGGVGYSHGGETLEELEIPFIVYGKGVKRGYHIAHNVFTYDNAATIAFILGAKPPYDWTGRPVLSAFEGFDEPDGTTADIKIAPPVIYPQSNLMAPAGGFYRDKEAEVRMESMDDGATIRYTLDGSEPDEQSAVYKTPFTLDHTSVVKAKSFAGGNAESQSTVAYFRIFKSNPDNGIHYDYYEGESWQFLPVFAAQKKRASGVVYEFRIGDIPKKKEQFAIRYTTFLQTDTTGSYKFYTVSDDGSKVYLDGELVVDNDGDHGPIERTGSVELTKGRHQLTVEYFNKGGGGWLDVYYRGPGIPKQIIPPGRLYLKSKA
ncbi:MAG TPA: alkaline phosphatase family protein [Chryseosolibacter sp.]|nr:alkaline phosphatase family protein [Chryseosolibacter sp.]